MVCPHPSIDAEPFQGAPVLVVDDEIGMRLFVSTLLETNGFTPLAARDGREGLKKAQARKPVLAILDIMMPHEGGVWLYRALKADDVLRDVPVLMLSGVTESAFRHYLTMLNSQVETPLPPPAAYLEKPPEADLLLATIHAILKTHSPESLDSA
ncbi:MAG: response regulator [Desulfobacterales bacterium]|jgi:DNA-binding response OmpR family regulator